MAEDDDQKTEEPTQKRLREAHEKGNVPISREVPSFFILALLAFTVSWLSPGILRNTQALLTPYIDDAGTMEADGNAIGHALTHAALGGMFIVAVPMLAAIAAAILAGYMQNGLVFSLEPLMPKLDKISPLSGFKRMFSARAVVEMLKGLLKIFVIMGASFLTVWPLLPHIIQLPDTTTEALLLFLQKMAVHITISVAIVMFFIAIVDTFWQRYQFTKSLRMTKEEIKDEYKQTEGDPTVKAKLKRMRFERARKRMMAAVPKADVIVTNPTHFAVALQYEGKTMKAPTVIAKGADIIAQKIREVAKEHNIPIVENPPLARALYDSTDIDQEIDIKHYEAVAKVISYVYGLKGKKMGARI